MAQKATVVNNTEVFNGIVLKNGYYQADIFKLEPEVETIFDVAIEGGIDLFSTNSEVIKGINLNAAGKATTYQVQDFAEFGLAGEYFTHEGKPLFSDATRFLNFAYGKEDAFQFAEYNESIDGSKGEFASKVIMDWRNALQKNREKVYFEQVVNSGMTIKSQTDLQAFYDDATGQANTIVAPANYGLLKPDEFEYFSLAVSNYYEQLGYKSTVPVIFVSTAEWITISKSESFSREVFASDFSKKSIGSTEIGMVHDCIVIKYSALGRGDYSDVLRIVALPGTAELIEGDMSSIRYEHINAAEDQGNYTVGTWALMGTYRQFVIIKDNLITVDGDSLFTKAYIVVGKPTLTQDATKVIAGQIQGDAPVVKPAVNRSFAEAVKASYDGKGDFSKGSAAAATPAPLEGVVTPEGTPTV